MDLTKEQRERRAYQVLDTVQSNLDEIDRRYRRIQLMLWGRYASILLVIVLIAAGAWWLWT